jgi:predicted CXXCH cytochrome family protein
MRKWIILLLIVQPTSTLKATPDPSSSVVPAGAALPNDYSCMFCHGKKGTLARYPAMEHLIVTEANLTRDVHWQKGLRCHDCHGGNPALDDYIDHRNDADFWPLKLPSEIPAFCGRCHSNIEFMRQFNPSPRTDQEAEYWTSGHGQKLREADKAYQQAIEKSEPGQETPAMESPGVATCFDCHAAERKVHSILAVNDQKSPVYPLHVAETCSRCHSDAELMAGRTYRDKPIRHDQYELWKESVHGQAMLEKGDLSAPTCNDCHGNHGALPPEVDSVANACGTCHVKVAGLFAQTAMKHRFEGLKLPGCAACHGSHQTHAPTDMMLGMENQAVCARCHQNNEHGATLAGADIARLLRASLDNLKQEIAVAEETVHEAERLGMEVRGPRFDLRQAQDALTNARSTIHTFAPQPTQDVIAEGLEVATEVKSRAAAALGEHTRRRVWLAGSLVPIFMVIVLLSLYIRTMPVPSAPSPTDNGQAP